MITKIESTVSEEILWSQAKSFRETSRGASKQEIADALASLTVTWFAWKFSLSERQSVEVLCFLMDHPEMVSLVKKHFYEWFNTLRK